VFTTSAIVKITDEKCVGCQRCVNVCRPMRCYVGSPRGARRAAVRGLFQMCRSVSPYDAISVLRDPHPRHLATEISEESRSGVEELCAAARLDPEAVICLCTSTTAGEVAAAVLGGVRVPEDLTSPRGYEPNAACGASRQRCGCSDARGRNHPAGEGPTNLRRWRWDGGGYLDHFDEVADRYPEYRLREDLEAVERTSASGCGFPGIRPSARPGAGR